MECKYSRLWIWFHPPFHLHPLTTVCIRLECLPPGFWGAVENNAQSFSSSVCAAFRLAAAAKTLFFEQRSAWQIFTFVLGWFIVIPHPSEQRTSFFTSRCVISEIISFITHRINEFWIAPGVNEDVEASFSSVTRRAFCVNWKTNFRAYSGTCFPSPLSGDNRCLWLNYTSHPPEGL